MLSKLINRITEYIKVKGQQIKLEVISHMSKLLSHVLVVSFLVLLGLFLILFLSFGLSAYLNEVLESTFLGYFVTGGIYLFVLIVIALLAKAGKVQRWIEKMILKASDEIEDDE
jgi:hypothetical protein